MKISELFEDKQMHDEPLFLWEMANLTSDDTGIPGVIIFISTGQGMRHGPRIKVAKGNKWSKTNATIPLEGMPRIIGDIGITPDEFADIQYWISKNKHLLLDYWTGKLQSTKVLVNSLKKISE